MARIKINLPDKFAFSTNIPTRISDINRGGHVSWNSIFSIMDEASVQFWNKVDGPADTAGEKVSHITVDAGINYKHQAYYGQTLKVEIGTDEFTEKSFDLVFKITEAESGTEIARAKAGILCYDYENQKVLPIPEDLKNRLLGIN